MEAPSSPVGQRLTTERQVVLTVALGAMLAPLNSTMIAVAMPAVIDEFNVTLARAGWLVTAYLIGMASLRPEAVDKYPTPT